MKKFFMSMAAMVVAISASAQVYVGGGMGLASQKVGDSDSKLSYKLVPEIGYQFNNKWDAGIEVGIQKGEVCKISPVGDATTFTIAPYVRYAAVESKVVDLFFEGTIGYGSVSKGGGDFYEVGIKPGLAVKLSDHVNFITKVGFLGYRGYSPDHGDNSSTFGLNVDASNISFGAIYKF